MGVSNKIKRLYNKPLLLNSDMGFAYLDAYLEELNILSGGNARDFYKERIEGLKPVLYAHQSGIFSFHGNLDGQATQSTQKELIGVVNLKGMMLAEGGLCTPGIDSLANDVRALARMNNVAGIIINTHTGGGEVIAAQRLSNAMTFARQFKPVVQYIDGVSASGGVWVGAHANERILNGNTGESGSVGVMMQYEPKYIQDYSENVTSVYADDSYEKGEFLKALKEGNHSFIKERYLNPIAKEFHSVVRKGMPNIKENALTGRMFVGKEVRKAGLVDSIGSIEHAMDRVIKLSKRQKRAENAAKAKKVFNGK